MAQVEDRNKLCDGGPTPFEKMIKVLQEAKYDVIVYEALSLAKDGSPEDRERAAQSRKIEFKNTLSFIRQKDSFYIQGRM